MSVVNRTINGESFIIVVSASNEIMEPLPFRAEAYRLPGEKVVAYASELGTPMEGERCEWVNFGWGETRDEARENVIRLLVSEP